MFAASVLATVADVVGNVIVVLSVPANVKVLLAVNNLPLEILIPRYIMLQDEASVPDVKMHVTIERVFPAKTPTAFPPDEFIVMAPVLKFLM